MTQWTSPFTNPFQAIRAASDFAGRPQDFEKAKEIFIGSMNWPTFSPNDYLDDLLQEIAGKTNIVVQYIGVGNYRAAYDL
jgi:hypothetical protein